MELWSHDLKLYFRLATIVFLKRDDGMYNELDMIFFILGYRHRFGVLGLLNLLTIQISTQCMDPHCIGKACECVPGVSAPMPTIIEQSHARR